VCGWRIRALIQRLSTCWPSLLLCRSRALSSTYRRATLSLPLCPRGRTFLPQCSTQYSMGRYRCYRPPTTTVVSSCVVSVGVTCEKENCNDVRSMRHFLSASAWQRDLHNLRPRHAVGPPCKWPMQPCCHATHAASASVVVVVTCFIRNSRSPARMVPSVASFQVARQ
jgi:hypothetical protein